MFNINEDILVFLKISNLRLSHAYKTGFSYMLILFILESYAFCYSRKVYFYKLCLSDTVKR